MRQSSKTLKMFLLCFQVSLKANQEQTITRFLKLPRLKSPTGKSRCKKSKITLSAGGWWCTENKAPMMMSPGMCATTRRSLDWVAWQCPAQIDRTNSRYTIIPISSGHSIEADVEFSCRMVTALLSEKYRSSPSAHGTMCHSAHLLRFLLCFSSRCQRPITVAIQPGE